MAIHNQVGKITDRKPAFSIHVSDCIRIGLVMCTWYSVVVFYGHRNLIPASSTQTPVRLPHLALGWSRVWCGKMRSCRAGDSSRMVERTQSWQRGARARIAPAVAKRTKPGDPLQAQVGPVVPIYLRENLTAQVLEATRSINAQAPKNRYYL